VIGLAKQYLTRLERRDFLAGAALVDGCWVAGSERAVVIDPATGEGVADAALCSVADVELAIAAAERAFPAWRELLPAQRGSVLKSWAALMRDHSDELAILVAAGCPVIVKPAPETPLSALALARLAEQAGMPPGVLQIVVGDPVVLSQPLLDDSRVRALSFTGSTEVGRLLIGKGADTIKKLSLELGGHAPFLVFDDANVENAVQGAMAAKFATSGQDCLAANRIYVQRGVYFRFVEAIATSIARLRVGHGLDPATNIGPMTKRAGAERCRAQIDDAAAKGADVIVGGRNTNLGERFVVPTLLAGVTDDMLIVREETFGPVAAVLPFDTEQEVLRRTNASEMGLAGYLYTNDLRRALRLSDRIECGMVGVNTASITGPPIPFGGWKQSGLGREGSRHGLAEYMELKYVCFGDLAA
jgi:aspartate-semialdehyde dehydrogenase